MLKDYKPSKNIQYAFTPHIGLSGACCRTASIYLCTSLSDETFLTYEVYDIKENSNPFNNVILYSPVEIFLKGYVDVIDKTGLEINGERLKLYLVS